MTGSSADQTLSAEQVLAVRNLSVSFTHEGVTTAAVRQLSLEVRRGETLAIVGESGSGKSVTSLALMRLIEQGGGKMDSGEIWLRRRNGKVLDLATARQSQMRTIRGADMAMIFQEPMTSLNPVFPVGEQIAESIRLHQGLNHRQALAEAQRMLDLVRIPEAKNVLTRYPHQLSGGMRKRVSLAQTLVLDPDIILMDEPFSALDIQTRQLMENEVLDLWAAKRKAVLFITHDLDEAIAMSDRVVVLAAGPGTHPIGEFTIDLPRPRDVAEIRDQAGFVDLHSRIWDVLREEVLKGYAQHRRVA